MSEVTQAVLQDDCSPHKFHPIISILKTKTKIVDPVNKIKILTIGEEVNKPIKSMVLIGATGSGKTTFVNGIINHLCNITFDSDVRYKIQDETGNERRHEAQSQTDYVTGYLVYHNPAMKHEYNFMIIDTPGLADTRGAYQQKQIVKQLKFFLKEEKFGVNELHSIGVVMQATVNRAMGYLTNIKDEFHDLFGADTADITNLLLTCKGPGKSKAPEVLKSINWKVKTTYSFDNAALYEPNKTEECNISGMTEDEINESQSCWTKSSREFNRLVQDLTETESVSLKLTREALQEKSYLERTLLDFKRNIEYSVNMLIVSQSQMKLLENYEESMKKNKDWIGKEKVSRKIKVPTDGTFTHSHNCKNCDITCISSCNGNFICWNPVTLWNQTLFPYWTTCSKCHCHNSSHVKEKFIIKEEIVEIEVTDEHMKEQYGIAINNKAEVEKKLKEFEEKNVKITESMAQAIKRIVKHTEKISIIGRNTNSLTAKQYVDNMIADIMKSKSESISDPDTKKYICSVLEKLPKMVDEIDLKPIHEEYEGLRKYIKSLNVLGKSSQNKKPH
ncbi:uncharacterized protein [Cherax quadricarinatus]|uniref:uncharacterized protein n=1 Tax=Cherax quadricarinatus TaxID=27406 RepID=UPI002378CB5D|nr:uncharacterized protein LOC128691801 [Cherax quadricarinatus]